MVCQCILVSAHPMFRALPMLPMQDQELESFLHIMKCATVFGMPKLLPYCEYHMALVSLQSPQQGVLIKQCWSEQLSARSLGCIAEGICRAFSGLHGEIVQGPQKTVPCTCECCQIRSNSYRRGGQCICSLQCSQPVRMTPPCVQAVLPGPKEFFKMASADKKS